MVRVDLINLKEEIYILVEYFGILAEDKNVQLELYGADIELNCDKSMFWQALSNLIANAIHYSLFSAK
jgi:two-component system heavy metal sensor histidine kinase CusS